MSHWVAGVDGCKAGWVTVFAKTGDFSSSRIAHYPAFKELLRSEAALICVDMPIGLAETTAKGGRMCDREARKVLSGVRKASLFPVPPRAAFDFLSDYQKACAAARANSSPAASFPKQSFNLFAKIIEIDEVMTPAMQSKIHECHPEVSFWAMNDGNSLAPSKKTPEGQNLRRGLLEKAGFAKEFLTADTFKGNGSGVRAGIDDFLDACACAWTAARIHRGEARRFPGDPPLDARGLRMEIWA